MSAELLPMAPTMAWQALVAAFVALVNQQAQPVFGRVDERPRRPAAQWRRAKPGIRGAPGTVPGA
ncbi:hypothetical protein DSCOOX_20630 [Desulfosarcina ovata subsp. ovata]|uniref:Uncharacterized protein n=1 Tax=Desulfosarcina ovata subsp. ovata TaxID=2752305 RepID=A0A5K8A8B0_9BACT|nr:hypothetical protein DSCOOX_20630 [Desulfosarcina ovata subsp. ovata]